MPLIARVRGDGPPSAPIDWSELKRSILTRLTLADEFRALGVEFTGGTRASGWRECRALGRPDRKPSAAVHLATGVYKSDGEDGGEVLGFFDFAHKYGGRWQTWREVLEHYAGIAGVVMPLIPRHGDKGVMESIYPYTDAQGNVLYEVVRYRRDDGSKTFRQRRPDPKGDWIWNLNGVKPVPYRLTELAAADSDEYVWITEGERDADLLTSERLLATTNHGGAGNTRVWAELAEHFRGRQVIILPDNDPAGRKHARAIAVALQEAAQSIRIFELSDLPPKGDVSDWLAAGGEIDELCRLAAGVPLWTGEEAIEQSDRDATVADLRLLMAQTAWLWPAWIPNASLTIVAAQAGTGKTRFCFDLHRRIRHGLAWPDGAAMTVDPDSRVLWVVADNQWQEMCDIPIEFGIPDELVVMNSTVADPFEGTSLQSTEELADFEARIARVKPVMVVIDTITNSSDFKSQDSSEAKRQYKPLQEIAIRQRVPILCLTHLNAGGKVLGRRAVEKARVAILMDCPDPDDQPNRRKLWVDKSKALKPPALGVTMTGAGNDYDASPPQPATGGRDGDAKTGPIPHELHACMEWLTEQLAGGPARVSVLRRNAEEAGFDAKTLYRSKDRMNIREYSTEGRKWWEVAANEPDSPILGVVP